MLWILSSTLIFFSFFIQAIENIIREYLDVCHSYISTNEKNSKNGKFGLGQGRRPHVVIKMGFAISHPSHPHTRALRGTEKNSRIGATRRLLWSIAIKFESEENSLGRDFIVS